MNIWELAAIPLSIVFFLLSFKRGMYLLAIPAMVCCLPIFLDQNVNEYIRVAIVIYWVILFVPTVVTAFDF